jgi:predicted acetyltransferase
MSDFQVRELGADDVEAALVVRANAFANPIDDIQRRVVGERIGRGASYGVDVDGRLAGLVTVHDLAQYFGGRRVPMGGIASVATSVEFRGRGIAPALMGHTVGTMREAGQVISTLHPATAGFYRRLGWELAGTYPECALPIHALAALPPGEPERLRTAGPADLPLLRETYARTAPGHDGWVDRPEWIWDHAYRTGRDGYSILACDADDGSGVDGFALYEQVHRPSVGYDLAVAELVAVDATTAVTLWRAIGSFAAQAEQVTTVGATGALLPFLLPDQHLQQTNQNDWMTRLVDAPGAIAARGYEPGVAASVHLDVRDPIAPWNHGPFVLTVADGVGTLEPGGTGEVQLGVHALSALYTGYASALDLASVGVVHGPAGACRTLDAVFAGPRPSMLDYF